MPKNIIQILIAIAVFLGLGVTFRVVMAATNIVATPTKNHYAWSDLIGWMDFYNTGSVVVTPQKIQGWASSSAGYVSLDCATSPPSGANICTQSNYAVANDGGGYLSGWGWNDTYGWISFSCGSNGIPNGCNQSNYQVYVDANGDFHGYAWNDVLGWISFNCTDVHGGSYCVDNNIDYRVSTDWRATSTSGYVDSSTFDTMVSGGAQINSIMWRGNLPAQSQNAPRVEFQLASAATSTGPWNFIGYDGTANTWYQPSGPGMPLKVDYVLHNNMRYFRYRVQLVSDTSQRQSPRVDEVIINWSR